MKIKYVILIVLAVALAISGLFYYILQGERKNFESEKEAFTKAQTEVMQEELERLKQDYESQYNKISIKGPEGNFVIGTDSLVAQLMSERAKIDRLQEELRSSKAASAERIASLTREVSTLRKVLKSYVEQIDSLHTTNERLRAENQEVRASYERSRSEVAQLSTEKSELTSRVHLAAKLDATAISIRPMDKRGKTTKNIDKLVNIEISFRVAKNVTASTGHKTFYTRIMRPDDAVLVKSGAGSFNFEGKSLQFSTRREVEYNGEETPVTMYWPVEESLMSGTYRVQIFADGNLIGSSSFTL